VALYHRNGWHYITGICNHTESVQKKIEWTLNLIQITQKIPEKYFKHLEGIKGLYEIRVEVRGWGT
jgi:hypothetical protein